MTKQRYGAETEAAIAEAFGRSPAKEPVASATSSRNMVEVFQEAGLCRESAERAARGLEAGRFFSFEHAAMSATLDDREQGNVRATSRRIAEVAATLPVHHVLLERRTPAQARTQLLERASAAISGDGRLKVCLISQGQGSSGYYPASTLQEAARGGQFPAGLHCYVDHPTESERFERPERSVRDLAGVLESPATYRDGSLFADVRVYASHRELITDRASSIGMSIRGDGVIESQQVGGVTRQVVTRIGSVQSCDFVTQAGRGGRILSVA